MIHKQEFELVLCSSNLIVMGYFQFVNLSIKSKKNVPYFQWSIFANKGNKVSRFRKKDTLINALLDLFKTNEIIEIGDRFTNLFNFILFENYFVIGLIRYFF